VRASGTAYRFDHNQLHELVYAALSPGLRQEYHGLLAEAMAEREGLGPENAGTGAGETVYFIARHGLLGSSPRGALPFLDVAHDYLLRSYRKAAAAAFADHALAAPGLLAGPERVDMLLKKAACVGATERGQVLEEALPAAESVKDPALIARAHSAIGSCLSQLSEFDPARTHLRTALELFRRADVRDLQPLVALGSVAWYLGEYEEAGARYAEALATAEEWGDERAAISPTWGLGLVAWNLGNWADSRDHIEGLLSVARRLGHRVGEFGALANLGPLYASLGDVQRAKEVLLAARELARSVGSRSEEAFCLEYLAAVELQGGALEAARASHLEALALRREIDHARGTVGSLIGLGQVEAACGKKDEARRLLEEARDLARKIGVPGQAALATVFLALLPGGDAATACKGLEAHESHLDVVRRMEGRLALFKATGDRAHLEEAHRLLCHVRDHAPDECRVAMIENVPLHREIMAACAAP
jgi:tetratricopeptide (TPR) repeat protein